MINVKATDESDSGAAGGRATAAAIPGATFVEIEGMAHDLPYVRWDEIISAIVSSARRTAK